MGFRSLIKSWLGDDAMWTPLGEGGARGGGYSLDVKKAVGKSLSHADCYRLVIPVHSAIEAIGADISSTIPRPFDAVSGEEIVAGDLVDRLKTPAPNMGWPDWIKELSANLNIHGEFAVWAQGDGVPEALLPLSPTMLTVEVPTKPPRTIDDVVQWRYNWADGAQSLIRADRVAFGRLFNPDPHSIRGLSPLVTGTVTATSQHRAQVYSKTFFENNAVPSHILKLPDGVPEATRKDIERRWLSEHGIWSNNAHKVAVISGKDAEFIPIEQPFQEGAFVELQKQATLNIAQLYRVPAIVMGIYDKTRFDTANQERKLFAESTLLPQIRMIERVLQHQLVDRHYAMSAIRRRRPRKPGAGNRGEDGKQYLSKPMWERFEKAMDERPRGQRIVLLIDADPMPTMNDVMLAKFENAEKMRSSADMSASEVIDYLKLDVAHRPERDEIWVKNDRICITDLEINKKVVPGLIPKPEGGGSDKPAPKKGEDDPPEEESVPLATVKRLCDEDRERVKAVAKFWRRLRVETLKRMAADEKLWSHADARAMEGWPEDLKNDVWAARFHIRRIIANSPDKKAAMDGVRSYFNSISKDSAIRKALGL